MPRRRQTAINLKKLETYPTLVEELQNNPKYADQDLTSLKLKARELLTCEEGLHIVPLAGNPFPYCTLYNKGAV